MSVCLHSYMFVYIYFIYLYILYIFVFFCLPSYMYVCPSDCLPRHSTVCSHMSVCLVCSPSCLSVCSHMSVSVCSPSCPAGFGGVLTQTHGCLRASCAVILLAGLMVSIWLIRFLASGVTVSHSGDGNYRDRQSD